MNRFVPEKKPTVYVNVLGGFSIKVGNQEINDNSNQSKKPWRLLEYLIIYQQKETNPDELINAIWGDSLGTNPGGALKTLMFRTRKLLEPLGLPPQNVLVKQKGSYAWNREYPTVLDIERFESICTQVSSRMEEEEETLRLCLEGISIYRGDVLPKSEYESWVVPLSSYYHTLYQKLVHNTLAILLKKEDFSQITNLCRTAVGIEPFDEEIRYGLVYSLYRDGHTRQAIEEYNHTMDLFYHEFSISPTVRFKDLYKTILNREQNINTNLDSIQEALGEKASSGAFYCEYPVFQDLFQLERRAIERTGDSIYLCLLTISDLDRHVPKPAVLNKAMEHLNHSIKSSLRCSDVYTRYSVSQYIILLPTVTREKGKMVLNRIKSHFCKQYNRKDLLVESSLQPLLPWERASGTIIRPTV